MVRNASDRNFSVELQEDTPRPTGVPVSHVMYLGQFGEKGTLLHQ